MGCKKHPNYKGKQKPRPSKKYPEGCPDCWLVYALMNGLKNKQIGDFYNVVLHEPKSKKEN